MQTCTHHRPAHLNPAVSAEGDWPSKADPLKSTHAAQQTHCGRPQALLHQTECTLPKSQRAGQEDAQWIATKRTYSKVYADLEAYAA